MKKDYYWDIVSEKISKLLKKHIKPDMSVLEIGFAGGHFLEWMNDAKYTNLHGIEIRKNQFLETKRAFENKNLHHIELMCGDIFKHNRRYDAIFSTGLIQCFNESDRDTFEKHVSQLADTAIFTVPEIVVDRNMNSTVDVAVAGCKEYKTGNITYELSKYYNSVRVGRIDKTTTRLDDTFIYYVCTNLK